MAKRQRRPRGQEAVATPAGRPELAESGSSRAPLSAGGPQPVIPLRLWYLAGRKSCARSVDHAATLLLLPTRPLLRCEVHEQPPSSTSRLSIKDPSEASAKEPGRILSSRLLQPTCQTPGAASLCCRIRAELATSPSTGCLGNTKKKSLTLLKKRARLDIL